MVVFVFVFFFDDLMSFLSIRLKLYPILKDFVAVFIIIVVPLIYATGHVIHAIDYSLLKLHLYIYKVVRNSDNLNGKQYPELALSISKALLYNHRVVNSIFKSVKGNKVQSVDAFWDKWYKIRNDGRYEHAEYWHRQNDLFKGIYLICGTSLLICIVFLQWWFIPVFLFLTIIFYFRAIQYADHFVETVILTFKNMSNFE